MSCVLLTQVGSYRLDSQGKMPGAKKVEYILLSTMSHFCPKVYPHYFVGACCLMAAIL